MENKLLKHQTETLIEQAFFMFSQVFLRNLIFLFEKSEIGINSFSTVMFSLIIEVLVCELQMVKVATVGAQRNL